MLREQTVDNREVKNKSTTNALMVKGNEHSQNTGSTAAASVTATTQLGRSNGLQRRKDLSVSQTRTKPIKQANSGVQSHSNQMIEERAGSQDPYQNIRFTNYNNTG